MTAFAKTVIGQSSTASAGRVRHGPRLALVRAHPLALNETRTSCLFSVEPQEQWKTETRKTSLTLEYRRKGRVREVKLLECEGGWERATNCVNCEE